MDKIGTYDNNKRKSMRHKKLKGGKHNERDVISMLDKIMQ